MSTTTAPRSGPSTERLVIVPNYWGKGPTTRAAWVNVRKAGGPTKQAAVKDGRWVEYEVHPDSSCDTLHGNIYHPPGHPPVRVAKGHGVE